MQRKFTVVIHDCMTSVTAPLKTYDNIGLFAEHICDFTFSFVTPVGSYNSCALHDCFGFRTDYKFISKSSMRNIINKCQRWDYTRLLPNRQQLFSLYLFEFFLRPVRGSVNIQYTRCLVCSIVIPHGSFFQIPFAIEIFTQFKAHFR